MLKLYNIPLTYKEGVYGIVDFNGHIDSDNTISLDYDAQYQILDYEVPVGTEKRGMTLYSVPEEELVGTLRAVYNKDGTLQNISAALKGRELLLYIRYENEECAMREMGRFAIQNANAIMEQIQQCTDVVARLFIEYYVDGETIDYHAVIGTAAQMEAVRQKYGCEDSCDNAGNYPSENIEGDNEMLITMVRCAEGYPTKNFRYVVDVMSQHIGEYALAALHKTGDFKYICAEYD